jgi:phage pi2 protein 07
MNTSNALNTQYELNSSNIFNASSTLNASASNVLNASASNVLNTSNALNASNVFNASNAINTLNASKTLNVLDASNISNISNVSNDLTVFNDLNYLNASNTSNASNYSSDIDALNIFDTNAKFSETQDETKNSIYQFQRVHNKENAFGLGIATNLELPNYPNHTQEMTKTIPSSVNGYNSSTNLSQLNFQDFSKLEQVKANIVNTSDLKSFAKVTNTKSVLKFSKLKSSFKITHAGKVEIPSTNLTSNSFKVSDLSKVLQDKGEKIANDQSGRNIYRMKFSEFSQFSRTFQKINKE